MGSTEQGLAKGPCEMFGPLTCPFTIGLRLLPSFHSEAEITDQQVKDGQWILSGLLVPSSPHTEYRQQRRQLPIYNLGTNRDIALIFAPNFQNRKGTGAMTTQSRASRVDAQSTPNLLYIWTANKGKLEQVSKIITNTGMSLTPLQTTIARRC